MEKVKQFIDKAKDAKSTWVLIVAIVGSVVTVYQWADTTYARADDLKQVAQKVDRVHLQQLHEKALNNYYQQKALSRKYPEDQELKDAMSKAKKRLDGVEKRLEGVNK